jgi:putative membrane protein
MARVEAQIMRYTHLILLVCLACNKTTPQTGGHPDDGTPSAPPVDPAVQQASLTDAEIAHILQASNRAEVEDGRTALQKSSHPEVQELAQMMVTDHGAADERLRVLLTQKGMISQPNPTSSRMQQEHAQSSSQLAALQGSEFDEAYVALQVDMHQQVLDTIDRDLLPDAQDPELKALITEIRPKIAAHLDHARMVQRELQKSAAPVR